MENAADRANAKTQQIREKIDLRRIIFVAPPQANAFDESWCNWLNRWTAHITA
jgi:hypothetical protein